MTILDPSKLVGELKKQGLVVHEMPNWRTRGHGSLDVHVIGVHDSVTGSMGDARAAQFVYDGRSDLPGPDYNLLVGGNGEVWLVSAVRSWNIGTTNKARVDAAWHAQMPMDKELPTPGPDDYQNANNVVFGFAFRTEGAGPYTATQYKNGVKAAAALGHALAWSPTDMARSCAGHQEVTRRKVDPQFDMGKFRHDVYAAMQGNPAPTQTQPKPAPKPTSGDNMDQATFDKLMDDYLDRRRHPGERTWTEIFRALPGLLSDVEAIKKQVVPAEPTTP